MPVPRKTFMPPPTAAKELNLPLVPGGFEDQVVVDDMGDAGEGGLAAAALQVQVALQESVAEFAADVSGLVVADVSAEGGAGLEARGGGAGSGALPERY